MFTEQTFQGFQEANKLLFVGQIHVLFHLQQNLIDPRLAASLFLFDFLSLLQFVRVFVYVFEQLLQKLLFNRGLALKLEPRLCDTSVVMYVVLLRDLSDLKGPVEVCNFVGTALPSKHVKPQNILQFEIRVVHSDLLQLRDSLSQGSHQCQQLFLTALIVVKDCPLCASIDLQQKLFEVIGLCLSDDPSFVVVVGSDVLQFAFMGREPPNDVDVVVEEELLQASSVLCPHRKVPEKHERVLSVAGTVVKLARVGVGLGAVLARRGFHVSLARKAHAAHL